MMVLLLLLLLVLKLVPVCHVTVYRQMHIDREYGQARSGQRTVRETKARKENVEVSMMN
jgi:hypothetical protein